jgi:lipoate-protein ligase A
LHTTRRTREEATSDEWVATRGAQRIEDNSLVLLQVNCRSILNKSKNFWNLVDIYYPNVIIGKESWLRKEISNAEVFRNDYTTFRRDRNTGGGGVFICVKNCIACANYGWTRISR